MYFVYVCCFILCVTCTKPSYDEFLLLKRNAARYKEVGKETEGKNMLGADMDVTQQQKPDISQPPDFTMTTALYPGNDEMTTPPPTYDQTTFDYHQEKLPEVQGLGLEEYFVDFARTELSSFLELIPQSSSRFLLSESDPCKTCNQKYFPCKEFCLELLTRSKDCILNSFICIVICWQEIINCCIISRHTKAQLESIN